MPASVALEDSDALAQAQRAWGLVSTEVTRAHALASELLTATTDPAVQSVVHRTLGLAALELSGAQECSEHMEASLAAARRAGIASFVAEAEMGLAVARFSLGDRGSALRLSRRAVDRAADNARLALQRALILERLGETADAVRAYDLAEELSRRSGDDETLARVWCNRGVLRIYAAELVAAQRDLDDALALVRAAGMQLMESPVIANLGYLAARRGRLVEALERLDDATPAIERAGGVRLGIHELDRCEVLVAAGLATAAVASGRTAIAVFERAGMAIELSEARLVTAQAALASGEPQLAEELAERAAAAFRRHGAGPWSALADDVAVRARWAVGQRDARLASRASRVAGALELAGWRTSAASARILSARIDLGLGRRTKAAEQLREVDDSERAPVGLRIQARCATALLRREAGDRRGARAALRSGWQLLERHRATLGATELRAGASAHVAEIVEIGLEMAIEDGRPREVLGWAERGRVGALTPRATAPPEDPELAALLGELRVVSAEADAAAKRGDDSRALLRRQASIEERVRGRARLVPAEEGGAAESPTSEPAEILAALDGRALIEYVVCGADLWAVVAVGARFSLRRIGAVAPIGDEVDALRVALRRVAFSSPVPQLRAAARDGADYARTRLRELLLAPLADLIGDRDRIIVPMGVLHAVPWAALDDGTGAHVIAPSASLWVRARRAPRATGGAVLVAGPRLAEADAEVSAIANLVPGAEVLLADAATVDATRDAMAGASLAHLACHGQFRADNPLFSALELHDGALSVFELERLGRAPQRIVLSACDAGLSAVHPGDELLGLAAALLRLGTTGIVASVLPVPDGATRRLMVALHEALATGASLSAALATARGSLDPERDDDLVASWAFQVLGAG